jgi:hypothetical protein
MRRQAWDRDDRKGRGGGFLLLCRTSHLQHHVDNVGEVVFTGSWG